MQGFHLEIDPKIATKLQDLLHSLVMESDCAPLSINEWETDEEFKSFWHESQKEHTHTNLKIFEDTFLQASFTQGKLILKDKDLEALLKSISYLRLRIQELKLQTIEELELEKGNIDLKSLDNTTQQYLWCYSMLAQIQELTLQLEINKGGSNA